MNVTKEMIVNRIEEIFKKNPNLSATKVYNKGTEMEGRKTLYPNKDVLIEQSLSFYHEDDICDKVDWYIEDGLRKMFEEA